MKKFNLDSTYLDQVKFFQDEGRNFENASAWTSAASQMFAEACFKGKNKVQINFDETAVGIDLSNDYNTENFFKIRKIKNSFNLHGRCTDVLLPENVRYIICPVIDGKKQVGAVLLDKEQQDFVLNYKTAIDPSFRVGEIKIKNLKIVDRHRLSLQKDLSPKIKKMLLDLTVFTCAGMLGAADETLKLTIDHVKKRKISDKPLSQFQTVTHRLTASYVALEKLRALLLYVANTLDLKQLNDGSASMLKLAANKICMDFAAVSIQLHGARAYQWVHTSSLNFKRAVFLQRLMGDSSAHQKIFMQEFQVSRPKTKKISMVSPLSFRGA